MNQTEFILLITRMRMTIPRTRLPMRRPPRMRHTRLGDERLAHVDDGGVGVVLVLVGGGGGSGGSGGVGRMLGDQLAQGGDFADLFEEDGGGFGGVAVDADT